MGKAQDAENIKRIMQGLKCSEDEAKEIYAYDRAVDKGEPTPYDLTDEQKKVVKQYTKADRKPTVYKFDKRERKANATKADLIAGLAEFLADRVESLEVTNKERQIMFHLNGETYEVTLIQKRKPK